MRGGFSFCGVDIADLGIEYAPEIEDTYVYKPAAGNVHEETFDGHHGSYIYGTWKEPKEFNLRCVFEKRIDRGLLAQVYGLFKIGRKGRLVFQRRPWIYYYATVTEIDDSDMLTYISGTIKIVMKASYPYGRSDLSYCSRNDEHYGEIMENTAFFDKEGMMPQRSWSDVTSLITPILPNPGTERAPLNISIAGDVGKGVIVKNLTNGQSCTFVAMTRETTTDKHKYVYVNGLNGKTTLRPFDASEEKLAFLYHKGGFITLEPAFPCLREIYASYSGKTVHLTNRLYGDHTGEYIFLASEWRKIDAQEDSQTLTLEQALGSGKERTTIMKMNELKVYPVTNEEDPMDLSLLEFSFSPTFS